MDPLVQGAVADGRIPAERAGHYDQMIQANPAQGAAVLAALAQAPPGLRPNAFPSAQQHALGIDDGADYPGGWLPEVAAKRDDQGQPKPPPVVTFDADTPGGAALSADVPSHGRMGKPHREGYGLAGDAAHHDYGMVGREH